MNNPTSPDDSSGVRKIEAIAFDLDGLMFNTEDLYDEVIDGMLRERGHQFSNELKMKMMGLPGVEAVQIMIDDLSLSEQPVQLLHEIHQRMQQTMPDRIQPMPGLLTLLDEIESAQLPKSIATSSSPEFAATALRICDLSQRFRFVLTTENVKRGKPFPDIYIESAARHGVAVENLLVLEDSLIGSRAAAASGAVAIAVPGHHSADQDFSHVDFRVERLDVPLLLNAVRQKQITLPTNGTI